MKRAFTTLALGIVPIAFAATFSALQAQPLLNPVNHPKFVNPLPVPSALDMRSGGQTTISVSQFNQWLGLVQQNGQPLMTTVWGYNGTYPGPTILAQKDIPFSVFWPNNLVDNSGAPLPHLLPVDPSIHWAFHMDENWAMNGVPIVTHLHGGHTESASDGLPDAWYTPGYAMKGMGFVKGDIDPYTYSNDQEAATIWYHDHALGLTRLNVYAGLAGYYLLTDSNEINMQLQNKLPSAPYDLGLAIQDRMFTEDGQLYYPSENGGHGMMMDEGMEMMELEGPSILPEFFGDFILVNGMTWPVLEVEPRPYRFRVLNGSDSRFYNLYLSNAKQFHQIASDNGFLNAPIVLDQMLIAPGERKDIVIDFSDPALWGQTLILKNNARSPFPKGGTVDPRTTGQIMAFRVNVPLNTSRPLTTLPATLRPQPVVQLQPSVQTPRKLILFEATDEYGRLKPMLGTTDAGVLDWSAPISENPALNATEVWEIYNETMDAHPIHLHLVSSQLISRQKFKANIHPLTGKPTNLQVVGNPRMPGADEQGWKDTWVMYPGEVTRIKAKFDLEGLYVWHCHILSHEDHEMMRPFYVGNMPMAMTAAKLQEQLPTSVVQEGSISVYPNPFSTNAAIDFELKEDAEAGLRVYSTSGQLMKEYAPVPYPAGKNTLYLHGQDLPAGIYFCELNIQESKTTFRIILDK